MNIEEIRLQTFTNWPNEAPVEAWRIAKGGFFATGNGLEVQCHWCGSKISEWEYGEPVMGKHRRLKPDCPFITNPTNSGNVPINSLQPPPTSEIAASDLMNEQCRLATFTNWPVPYITPQSLAKAGFFYFSLTDHVRCAWCSGVIAKWEIGDNPFTEHLRFFPNCPRAQLGPNIEINQTEPVQTDESIRLLGIQQIRAPKKERYSSLDARIRSFANWPRSSVQSPETLASAGFYYQNTDDQVLCFQCNGGLRSWQREDDAWFEHARWFPKCEFVQLVKGPQYIAQVQQQARQGLDEAMSSEPVQKALQLGLSEGRIRAVTKFHLERFGSPFKCAETLIDAVLDYQREEEQQQDGDDDEEQSSSAIVREVGRILDTIFNNNHDSTSALLSTNSNSGRGIATTSHAGQSAFNSQTLQPLPLPLSASSSSSSQSSSSSSASTSSSSTSAAAAVRATSVASTSTTETTSIANHSEQSSHSVSQQNESIAQLRVPETSTNEMTGIGSNSACSSSSMNDCSSSSSSSDNASGSSSTRTNNVNSSSTAPKKMSLEEENRQLKDARLCKVCMDDDVAVVFLPCGHLVTCVQCAPSVTACPLCRTAIKAFVRTFLS